MKIFFVISLIFCFHFSFSQETEEFTPFQFANGTVQKILVDHVKVRDEPSLSSKCIDSLSLATEIKIISRTITNVKIGERFAPWYKISYSEDHLEKTGFIWGGNISLGHRKYNDLQFLFGIAGTERIKNIDNEDFHDELVGRVIALRNKKVIAKKDFKVGNSENLVGYGFKILPPQNLKNVEAILECFVAGEACGIPTYEQNLLWTNDSFYLLPQLMSVSDAGVFYHNEKYLFQGDGKIFLQTEEVEIDENDKETKSTTTKKYIWDGFVLKNYMN